MLYFGDEPVFVRPQSQIVPIAEQRLIRGLRLAQIMVQPPLLFACHLGDQLVVLHKVIGEPKIGDALLNGKDAGLLHVEGEL